MRSLPGRDGTAEPPPPPPPNPTTPYDDVGQVQMSMRILTDEGEEKDLYSIAPQDSEEEKWTMPPHLKCAACQASAHQGAIAVSKALHARYKDDLIGVTALEAMQDLCDNTQVWMTEYGLVPTKTGVNAITGPGISARQGELLDGNQVPRLDGLGGASRALHAPPAEPSPAEPLTTAPDGTRRP